MGKKIHMKFVAPICYNDAMENDWFKIDREKQEIEVSLPNGEPLRVTKDDLDVSYYSGGPGGQNVNKNMNGVRLIYRIPESHLQSFRKTRELVSRSINQRSREQNLKDAFESLAQKLERYFYLPPERKETRVPKKSKEKRLKDKKSRASIKEGRKKVEY